MGMGISRCAPVSYGRVNNNVEIGEATSRENKNTGWPSTIFKIGAGVGLVAGSFAAGIAFGRHISNTGGNVASDQDLGFPVINSLENYLLGVNANNSLLHGGNYGGDMVVPSHRESILRNDFKLAVFEAKLAKLLKKQKQFDDRGLLVEFNKIWEKFTGEKLKFSDEKMMNSKYPDFGLGRGTSGSIYAKRKLLLELLRRPDQQAAMKEIEKSFLKPTPKG